MIEINSLYKRYGDKVLFEDLNLSIGESDLLHLKGENGSGKTTLLNIIAGLEKADKGEVKIDSKIASDPNIIISPSKRKIGFVFQDAALWSHLRVSKNFALVRMKSTSDEIYSMAINDPIVKPLLNEYPGNLSGGEQRIISLYRTLLSEPEIVFLDEAFTNLSNSHLDRMKALCNEYYEDRKPIVVFVSHRLEENPFTPLKVLDLNSVR